LGLGLLPFQLGVRAFGLRVADGGGAAEGQGEQGGADVEESGGEPRPGGHHWPPWFFSARKPAISKSAQARRGIGSGVNVYALNVGDHLTQPTCASAM